MFKFVHCKWLTRLNVIEYNDFLILILTCLGRHVWVQHVHNAVEFHPLVVALVPPSIVDMVGGAAACELDINNLKEHKLVETFWQNQQLKCIHFVRKTSLKQIASKRSNVMFESNYDHMNSKRIKTLESHKTIF